MGKLIDGVTITMGGAEYIVPPLTFRQLRALQKNIETLGKVESSISSDQMESICTLVYTALSRNYPKFKKSDLEDLLDLGNVGKIIGAIMGVSGLEKSGEAAGNP